MVSFIKLYAKRIIDTFCISLHVTHNWSDLFRVITCFQRKKLNQRFHENILKYLEKELKPIIEKHKSCYWEHDFIKTNAPIWILWLQGEKAMPEIVRICYRSVQETANGHPVHLVTLENLDSFVQIPQYISDLYKAKDISSAQFSDIIRMGLLSTHGGCWIDATVLSTAPINLNNLSFFTLKQNIPDNFFTTEYQWTGFLLAGSENNPLFHFVYECFLYYWKRQTKLIHYFLIDYIIRLGYIHIPSIQEMIKHTPYNNPNLYWLQEHLNNQYDKQEISVILENTNFHKLTWKKQLEKKDKNNNLTYYGHLSATANK